MAARIGSTSPRWRSSSMASPKAPTPGTTTRSAAATTAGSEVTVTSPPTATSARATLRRLPMP